MKFIYIFNLISELTGRTATFSIDTFLEIDGEVFHDKHRLHYLSNYLPQEHKEKIKSISNNIKMMEVRLKMQQNVCSPLLRIDSDEKITRETLKSIIDSTEDIDEFISKYKFNSNKVMNYDQ